MGATIASQLMWWKGKDDLTKLPWSSRQGFVRDFHLLQIAIGSSYPWMFFLPADRKTKPDSVVVDFSLQEKEFQWLTHACKSTFKWWNTWNVYRTHVFVCTNADTLSYLCPIFYLTIYAGYACNNVDEWPRSYRLSVGRRDDGHWDIERSLGGGQNLVEACLAVVFIVELMLHFFVWGPVVCGISGFP